MTYDTTADTQAIDSLVCVVLDIHLWSGRRKLTPKDLIKVAPEDIPPEEIASLGSKKICNPADLAVFSKLKRQAERLLLESGYRFLGGYGIPEDKLDEVRNELQRLASEFDAQRSRFLANYDAAIEQWIANHSEWESIIRKAAPPAGEVAERLQFNFRLFRVAPAKTTEAGEDADLLEGSYQAIVREVAQTAQQTWDKTFKGREAVTQHAVRPIRRMRDKLNGLSFIDARIYPVVDLIDRTLETCPKTGAIQDAAMSGLASTVLLLSDADRMVAHGEAALGNANASAPEDDVSDEAPDGDLPDESVGDSVDDPANDSEAIPEQPVPPHKRPAVSESGLFI